MKNEISMYEKSYIELVVARLRMSLPLHSHECFCLGIVRGGEVTFQIGDREKKLSKGMMYLIPPNIGVTIIVENECEYTTMCFKGRLKDMLTLYEYEDYFPETDAPEKIEEYCSDFLKEKTPEEFFLDVYPIIMGSQRISEVTQDADKVYCIELAKNYIKKHVKEEFDLDELCEYVHLSKFHFIRLFKKETGVSPNQYYIQAKLYVVKQRLKNDEKLTDLAADMNFADQSYMSNQFKKRMGISLKNFQKNYNKE